MKNLKKILIAISVCVSLPVCCGVAALATDYTGTVDELDAIVVELEEATTAKIMQEKLRAAAEYLEKSPVDPSSEGYGDVMARLYAGYFDCVSAQLGVVAADTDPSKTLKDMLLAEELWALLDVPADTVGYDEAAAEYDETLVVAAELLISEIDANIETTLETAKNKPAINRLASLLKNTSLKGESQADAFAAIREQFDVLNLAHENAVSARFAELDNVNTLADYDKEVFTNSDFSDASVGLTDNGKNVGGSLLVANKNGTVHPLGVGEEEDGNKYVYGKYTTGGNSYHYINLYGHDSSRGFVFELDFTTMDVLPDTGVKMEAGGFDHPTAGRIFPPYFFNISGEGAIQDNKGNVLVPNAIVAGEWISIMVIFDPAEFTYSVYVEGQYLSTQTAKYTDTGKGVKDYVYDLTKGHFRIGTNTKVGEYAVDNLKFYSGTNYREVDKFSTMTEDELFLFYTNYFSDDTKDLNGRNISYSYVEEHISNYAVVDEETGVYSYVGAAENNVELQLAVDTFFGFDLEELLTHVRDNNLELFKSYVEEVMAIERSTDTISTRNFKIAEINTFITAYQDLINKEKDSDEDGEPDYRHYNAILSQAKRELDYDSNAVLFVRYMTRYQKVSTVSALERYYDRAKELVESGVIDLELIRDESHPARESFAELIAAYDVYLGAEDYIKQLIKREAAKKIVICIGHINEYTTVEEWLAHEEEMNKYLEMVKEEVLSRDENGELVYDEKYDGVREAVAFFDEAYGFFYARLQDNHVAYLTEILDKVAATDAYVEKMGMIAMLERYLANSEVNYEDARIVSLINDMDTCRAELELREVDYAKILVQNAVYFVNLVEYMRTAPTYVEQKKYFDEAELYFYNMDITVEGARAAAAIYEEYSARFELISISSEAFLEAVAVYTACETEEDKYAALVNCYYYAENAEMTYAGVSEAMAIYKAAYDAYMGYAEAVNNDIAAIGNAVGSLRSHCGITQVIAIIIKKVFGR